MYSWMCYVNPWQSGVSDQQQKFKGVFLWQWFSQAKCKVVFSQIYNNRPSFAMLKYSLLCQNNGTKKECYRRKCCLTFVHVHVWNHISKLQFTMATQTVFMASKTILCQKDRFLLHSGDYYEASQHETIHCISPLSHKMTGSGFCHSTFSYNNIAHSLTDTS